MNESRSVQGEGRSATRARIIETARCLFVAQGYDCTSIRGVARAAGLSDAAIHYYFNSKRALLCAVLEAEGEAAMAAANAIQRECTGREGLISGVLEYFFTYAHRPELVRMLLREQIVNEPVSVASGERLASEFGMMFGAAFEGVYGEPGRLLLDTLEIMLAGTLWNELLEENESFTDARACASFRSRVRGLIDLVMPVPAGEAT